MTPTFKPSQVRVDLPIPFVGTFGASEAEQMAALLVLTLARSDDAWRPVKAPEIGQLLQSVLDKPTDPVHRWASNPFMRPDVWRLIKDGYTEWEGGVVQSGVLFTDKGLSALSKWVPPAEPSR